MLRTARIAALALGLSLTLAPAAFADDPIKDVIDAEVPALKDGTRIALADVQTAILEACKRRRFETTVDSEGLITASWRHGIHEFSVSIPFSTSKYSIRYKDSKRMDYNEARKRIDDSYNEVVAALDEHVNAQFERELKKLKVAMKAARKGA
jgi:hypothetical protein